MQEHAQRGPGAARRAAELHPGGWRLLVGYRLQHLSGPDDRVLQLLGDALQRADRYRHRAAGNYINYTSRERRTSTRSRRSPASLSATNFSWTGAPCPPPLTTSSSWLMTASQAGTPLTRGAQTIPMSWRLYQPAAAARRDVDGPGRVVLRPAHAGVEHTRPRPVRQRGPGRDYSARSPRDGRVLEQLRGRRVGECQHLEAVISVRLKSLDH